MGTYSNWRADMARNRDTFGKLTVTLLRLSHAFGPLGIIPDITMRVICGAEIPRTVPVGPGLLVPHGARGVVVHPNAKIGADVTLQHGSTLGVAADHLPPTIGDRVYIGAGARILGNIHVRDDAKVGANAVVLHDVDAGITVVGIPARPLTPASP